jgi:hypothetical protein
MSRKNRPAAKAARRTARAHVDPDIVYTVCAEVNRVLSERRERECRCPGRADVVSSWDLEVHDEGCLAGYAFLSVDDVRSALQQLARNGDINLSDFPIGRINT